MLFMDEPTTGLDPQARHLIWERLRHLAQEGRTLVLTTHFMEEAERLCNRVAIMDRGRIIVQGTPRALIAQHIEPHVVEVHGPDLDAWLEKVRPLLQRSERAGDTVFCYASNAEPLIASLGAQPELVYLHRPANLEDLFLKLTGRDLRD
jgi:lipooligosaccharide transport system ATP-binding protein